MPPGSLAIVSDHINLTGLNPLIGEKDDSRFVPMSNAYDVGLRTTFHALAKARNMILADAIYQWFPGPSFETAAEIRAASLLGADLVGMSTVPEVIIARHIGLKLVLFDDYVSGHKFSACGEVHTPNAALHHGWHAVHVDA